MTPHRIGLVVPSSNITVETEVPALLARHGGERFSFHSSRMRMHTVSPEQLRAMNTQRERCVGELADARVDALLYACQMPPVLGIPKLHVKPAAPMPESERVTLFDWLVCGAPNN